jgi:hypothetical protein
MARSCVSTPAGGCEPLAGRPGRAAERAGTHMAPRCQSHAMPPRADPAAVPSSGSRRQCDPLRARRAGAREPGCGHYSFPYSHLGTASSRRQQPARCRLACPSTCLPWTPWRRHRQASRCVGRGPLLRSVFFIVGLLLVLGGADAQGFWKSARPPDVHAGLDSVSVIGAGFTPGAADYVCSFRTDIVNTMLGEFETRTSPLRVISSTDAACPVPSWGDLPATTVAFQIYKADALLEKQVRSSRDLGACMWGSVFRFPGIGNT